MKLHEISVKKPVAVTMVVLMFVVIGLYALTMLPLEMTPDMELSMAIVATQYPNVGSEEVENMVTKPIENAVASISGVDTISSQSSEGMSMVMVQFANGTDMDKATADMESNIGLIESFLPDGATDPIVVKLDTDMIATAQFSVAYDGYDLVQTKQFVDDVLEAKVKSIDGVASVTVTGSVNRQIDVYVDPAKLYGYNMSLTDVANSIMAQNVNLPAGTTNAMGKKLSARLLGKLDSLEEINSIPLMTSQGQVISLRDIATVEDSFTDVSGIARLNGSDAICVTVSKESDANTVEVVKELYDTLDKLHESNPKFTYNMTMEQGTYIEDSVNSVAENAVTGAFLAILVLLLFLGSIRTSLVIGISMPVSVITTFIGMYFSGMSLNVVSLGGLALGVGMLVDNSVVVLENIFRHRKLGEDAQKASVSGSGEVVGAVIASVLTTCIVYVPILFIDNMMAIMFKQLAFSIIFSQTASLITTFLLIPMLSSGIKSEKKDRDNKLSLILKSFDRFMDKSYGFYERSLRKILGMRKKFILVIVIAFVVSIISLSFIGMELMPSDDSGIITVNISLPSGTPLEKTDKMTSKIEKLIAENENVKDVFTIVGTGTDAASSVMGGSKSDSASITVSLKEAGDRKDSVQDVEQQIREVISEIAGVETEISAQSMMMVSSSDEMSVQFSATDDKLLEMYVKDAQKILAEIDGVAETTTSVSDAKYELHIKPNREKALMYGLTPAQTAALIDNVMSGITASRYTDGGSEFDIKLKYPDEYANTFEKLKALRIKSPSGVWVAISDIADISQESGYVTLTRNDQRRVVTLSAKLNGTDLGTATREFDRAMESLPTPDGIMRESAGTFEVMIDAMSQLLVAILLGILLMYMIMAAQFGNLLQPLIILTTIPLAMIGVVLSLIITGSRLSAVSCVGILMLVGIIVNNAIILIEFINTSRQGNTSKTRNELIIQAGLVRMRPILMTSLTSILGFLPMALSGDGGEAMMQPLAVVLLGGLLVGTFLTLYVIPVVYTIVDDKAKKYQQKRKEKADRKAGKGELQ